MRPHRLSRALRRPTRRLPGIGEFARRRVNDEAWLPASSHITAKGRTLLFRPFSVDVRTDYRDYKKFTVDTKVTFEPPKQ